MTRTRKRVAIMGAAGRDFHVFNMVYRDDPGSEVVAFTAAQIPGIASRRYPAELAGPRYPDGIPIRAESELEAISPRERDRPGRLRLQRRRPCRRHAQGLERARGGRGLRAARSASDDAPPRACR